MQEYTWYNAPYEWSFGKDRMRSALEDISEPKVRWKWKYWCCCCKTDDLEEINEPLRLPEDNG